ncbi:hypothetical protein ACFVVQ_13470 [Paenibacillus chitinolyticus]|uniref:hypothetical protein n=1 Tax=Paenibacillus chitinolyticus TaxID=79263 RepID=UPI0036DEA1AD
MNRKTITIILLILVLLFFGFYYQNVFSKTVAEVNIVEKNIEYVIIKFEDGSEKKVNVNDQETNSINIGNKYFVVIYENLLRKPFFHEIKAI